MSSDIGHDVIVDGTLTASTSLISSIGGDTLTINSAGLVSTATSLTITANELLINATTNVLANSFATKSFVDSTISGFDLKESCRVKTDIALTYIAVGAKIGKTITNSGTQAALSIDGIFLAAGERVLVDTLGSASDIDNGIYTVTDIGSGSTNWIMTRATDFDENSEVTSGAYTFVTEGSLFQNGGYIVTTIDANIDIDVNTLEIGQFNAGDVVVIQEPGDMRVGNASGNRSRLATSRFYGDVLSSDSTDPTNGLLWKQAVDLIDPYGSIEFKADYFGDGSDGKAVIDSAVSLDPSGLENEILIKNYLSLEITGTGSLTCGSRRPMIVIFVMGDCTIDGVLSMNNCGANVTGDRDLGFTRATFNYTLPNIGSSRVRRVIRFNNNNVGGGGGGAIGVVGGDGTSGTTNGPETGFDNNDPVTIFDGDGESGGGGGGGGSTTNAGGNGSAGNVFGGGSGGGGAGTTDGDDAGNDSGLGGASGTGGTGVGAGNALAVGGIGAITNGGGGNIVLIVGGNLSVTGTISATGDTGNTTTGTSGGGGGSGGGNIVVYYGGTYTPDLGTYDVSGGAGGGSDTGAAGGSGGSGSIQGPFQIMSPSIASSLITSARISSEITLDTRSNLTVGQGSFTPIDYTAAYVAATSADTNHDVEFGINPTLSKIGVSTNVAWRSTSATNQKYNIDLGAELVSGGFKMWRYHETGANTNVGVQNYELYASNTASVLVDVTYASLANLTLITSGAISQHPGSDIESIETVTFSSPQKYRYYVFRFADNYGNGTNLGFRHVEITADLANIVRRPLFPSVFDATTAVATTENASYPAPRGITIHGNKISTIATPGAYIATWESVAATVTNQKFIINLESERYITGFRLYNYNDNGSNTTRGVQNYELYGSNNVAVFSDLTYSSLTNLTLITSGVIPQSLAIGDSTDVTFAGENYQYYVFRFADNYGDVTSMGIRHVQMISGPTTTNGITGVSSSFGATSLTWKPQAGSNDPPVAIFEIVKTSERSVGIATKSIGQDNVGNSGNSSSIRMIWSEGEFPAQWYMYNADSNTSPNTISYDVFQA